MFSFFLEITVVQVVVINTFFDDLVQLLRVHLELLLALFVLLVVDSVAVLHRATCVVVGHVAEGDALLERKHRLRRGIDVGHLTADDPLVLVVNVGIDDTIANGLGDNVFCVLRSVHAQLAAEISETDAGVALAHAAEGHLDDVVSDAVDEGQRVVFREGEVVLIQHSVEAIDLSKTDARCQDEVGLEGEAHLLGAELRALWDDSAEKLDDKMQLCGNSAETKGLFRSFAQGLCDAVTSFSVIQLHSLHDSNVVEEARALVCAAVLLAVVDSTDELVSLIVVLVVDVVSEERVDNDLLAELIVG
eukprot:PhM_4_TR17978/c0_g1_i1/m.20448